MKRPNITPGDWRRNSVAVHHDIHDVLSQEGATIAFIPGKGIHRKADGQFIAAAPDMAKALEDCIQSLDRMPETEGAYKFTCIAQAKAALIKAGYDFP